MKGMKLTAGMNAVEDYAEYVKAGADEVFVGYVPEEWQLRWGLSTPLNRREVCFTRVQLGTEDELRLLRSLREEYGAPVSITLNGLSYAPQQYGLLLKTVEQCLNLGFDRFIIADFGLLLKLSRSPLAKELRLQLSGEVGVMNALLLGELRRMGAERVIFHRKLTLPEMAELVQSTGGEMEYEAFLMNENCHFHGGYCNSLHCDALPPLCRVPYRLGRLDGAGETDREVEKEAEADITEESAPAGHSGCGLCALPALEQAGITHLKIVGRGAFSRDMLRDIAAARRALTLLEASESLAEYRKALLREVFPKGCGGSCYYPPLSENFIDKYPLFPL